MRLVGMQRARLPAHHGEIDLIIQPCHDDQIQFYLLRLNFHMLQEFHGEAALQLQPVFHQQDGCNPSLDQSSRSSLILFQAHRVS